MQEAPRAQADVRRRAVAASAVVALVLVLAVGTLYGSDRGNPAARGPISDRPAAEPVHPLPAPPSVDPAVLRVQALDELLETRSAAVLDRDPGAWMGAVDPLATEFAGRQAAVFANLEAVPLAQWRYEYAGSGPELAPERAAALGPDAWVARTVLSYRLVGPDLTDVRREQHLTLVRRGERWLIASDADGVSARDLWDLGPVQVVRGFRSLVLGTAAAEQLQRFADETDRATEGVDAVWRQPWPRTVVVLVPRTQSEMAALLRRPDEVGLDQIAAVTTGELGAEPNGSAANRIVVNPAGFERLGNLGRQVVLRHEITHLATRSTTSGKVPVWLSEGFADYVAYRDSGVARAVVAQDVLERVRAGQPPTDLQGPADFDPALGDVAPAYAAAWLAAELVERRWGERALVDLYASVASGAGTEQAFRSVLGIEQTAFTQEWRAYLTELAL